MLWMAFASAPTPMCAHCVTTATQPSKSAKRACYVRALMYNACNRQFLHLLYIKLSVSMYFPSLDLDSSPPLTYNAQKLHVKMWSALPRRANALRGCITTLALWFRESAALREPRAPATIPSVPTLAPLGLSLFSQLRPMRLTDSAVIYLNANQVCLLMT